MLLAHIQAHSSLVEGVKKAQWEDSKLCKLKQGVEEGKMPALSLDEEGFYDLRIGCVPEVEPLRRWILDEAHKTAYPVHPGATKMYQDLRQTFWWEGIKRDVADYVSRCLTCQQVKVEHRKPVGLLQQIEIRKWKWEIITMDFVVGLLVLLRGTTPFG